MSRVWVKVFVLPSMFFLAQFLFKSQFEIKSDYFTLLLGFIMVLVSIGTEVQYLKLKGNWYTTAIEFAAASCLVYLFRWVVRGAHITFEGALAAGLLVAAAEYGQHEWVLRTGQVWKKPKPEGSLGAITKGQAKAIDIQAKGKKPTKTQSKPGKKKK